MTTTDSTGGERVGTTRRRQDVALQVVLGAIAGVGAAAVTQGVLGGPAWLVLVVALVTGSLVGRATSSVLGTLHSGRDGGGRRG